MFLFSRVFVLSLLASAANASFERDVVTSKVIVDKKIADPMSTMQQELLAHAMPVKEFEAKYGVTLQSSSSSSRALQQQQEDDNNYERISFTGYSMKYAKCQPVQYFSDRALQLGEHSPMITSDIVILRLCPSTSCSAYSKYGCHYNYAEYAIALADYLRIMLNYEVSRRGYMCTYCKQCLNSGGRALQEEQEQAQAESSSSPTTCSTWSTYCTEYDSLCNQQSDGSFKFEDYLNYLSCTGVNNNAYFVKPRCDGNDGAIQMGIFYDQYCNQYAGSKVSFKDTGVTFPQDGSLNLYSSSCVDCSESNDYPPYAAGHLMCNRIHRYSAKCASELVYDLFDRTDNEEECSFIESIRFGTYNAEGQFAGRNPTEEEVPQQVTTDQKALLGGFIALSILLIIYACYLHHAMTNLLIKSLSHRELLPPHRQYTRQSNSPRRTGRRLLKVGTTEPDWDDDSNPVRGAEYA